MALADKARMLGFVAELAVKEHLASGLAVRPLVAELFLTDNCNLRCVSCNCWRSITRNELSREEWTSVIDQLADLNFLKVNFTGGEPLLRHDAPDLIAYARDRELRNLHLNTNAVLLDERRRTAVLDAGIRSFNISVDGPDARTHDAVRGHAGAFDTTMQHLKALVAHREELNLRVRMNYTVMRSNLVALPDIMRLAQRLQVRLYLNLATDHTFLFRHAAVHIETRVSDEAVDRALAAAEDVLRRDRRMLPRFSELAYLRRHFDDVVQRAVPCAESQAKLLVRSTGQIGGCWGHDGTRNVRTTPIAELIASAEYREEHDRFFRKQCVGCGSGYPLNLARRPSTYLADLQFRLGRRSLTSVRADAG